MNKKKILLIDDEDSICELLKMHLENKGDLEVTTAISGEEGLKRAEEIEFDLVITDYQMPRMSGRDVLNAFKKKDSHYPVVFLSVYYDDVSTIDENDKALADGVLSKPVDYEELYASIKEVLKKKEDEGK